MFALVTHRITHMQFALGSLTGTACIKLMQFIRSSYWAETDRIGLEEVCIGLEEARIGLKRLIDVALLSQSVLHNADCKRLLRQTH